MIPALKNAEFVRYGVMHRNTFIDSPRLLRRDFSMKTRPDLFLPGSSQAGRILSRDVFGPVSREERGSALQGRETLVLPRETMMGALSHYISDESVKDFQPMGLILEFCRRFRNLSGISAGGTAPWRRDRSSVSRKS